ncbi:hypothetical protein [Streptomyces sp. NRRL WC-3549]|uniref:hypothetical protein n=1 Tax=Streptomyces sp. NRRL WC-3549 TaxID=1463925 RepID=UPI0004C4A2EC|nr:hypothetical protein [Streptomyces sp. NRRL WC-3549]
MNPATDTGPSGLALPLALAAELAAPAPGTGRSPEVRSGRNGGRGSRERRAARLRAARVGR